MTTKKAAAKKANAQWEAENPAVALNLLYRMSKNLGEILSSVHRLGGFSAEYNKTVDKHEIEADRRQEAAEQRASSRMREDSASKIFAALVQSDWKPDLRNDRGERIEVNDDNTLENMRLERAIALADRLREKLAATPDPNLAIDAHRAVYGVASALPIVGQTNEGTP